MKSHAINMVVIDAGEATLSAVYRLLCKFDLQDLTYEQFLKSYAVSFDNGYRLYGYYEQDDLLALVGLRIMPDPASAKPYMLVNNLIVEPTVRNQGIGTRLLEFADELAVQQNYSSIGLNVLADNEQAAKLYKDYGFKLTAHSYWLKK